KPVYCSECFTSRGGGSVSDRTERRDQRPRFQDKKMFDAICATCGKRFELPFRPTEDRPVYCKDCFDKNGDFSNKSSKTSDQYKDQFDALNAKLDRILKILNPSVKEEKKDVVIERKEIKIEKKEKPKKSAVVAKKEKPKKSAVVAKKEKPKNLKKTASKKVAIKKKAVKK
ncbi:MAG: CxxC-x17-CxxC domain-containing protein, partial [Candidatus Paceibacterota bacterium]